MIPHDNRHSVLVAWLKIILPLAALGILSTLFLVSRTIDPSDAIPYADVDVNELARQPRITAPNYAGITSDGAALTISAAEARPEGPQTDSTTATTLRAALITPDGGRTDVTAATASINTESQQAVLEGKVEILTSTGYVITADRLITALDQTMLESDGPVQATGPVGRLDAGQMSLTEDSTAKGTYLLVFKNGVKLVYLPEK
jgi:lipopolysaccharide export system protein LptC